MLTPPPTTPWWILFIEHQTGFFSLLLWAASILCFVSYGLDNSGVDNLYLGIVLAVVVFLTGVFSYYQEASSAAVMAGFKNMIPPQVSAIRDGTKMVIDAKSLVPGDVVLCLTGEKMPADVRICDFTNFKCDQSSLTGEPDAIKKMAQNKDESGKPMEATNLAFFGTMVAEGEAKGFVILTGDDTVMGHIAALATGTEADDTPIAKEIHHFIILISALAIILGVTFFIVSLTIYDVVKSLVFGIGIIVANVPEGLLATVTVSLTLTAKRLAVKKVLVKQLESVETLGSTTCICSDKTGTLTQNRMTVQHVYVNDTIYEVPAVEAAWSTTLPKGIVPSVVEQRGGAVETPNDLRTLHPDAAFEKLYKFGVLCNKGFFTADDKEKECLLRLCSGGNASDYAFLKMAETIPAMCDRRRAVNEAEFAIDLLRKEHPQNSGPEGDIPFNSKYKFMTAVCEMEGEDVVIMKGAAEQVFQRCSHIEVNGEIKPIDAAMRKRFDEVYNTVAKMGERCLGFGYKKIGAAPEGGWKGGNPEEANYPLGNECISKYQANPEGWEATDDALIYLGLMALIDPPREAVPSSVLMAQRAGVKVVMVTGDHPVTAAAIAKTVNIVKSKVPADFVDDGKTPEEAAAIARAIVCKGTDLDNMTEVEIQHVMLYDQVVFARTSPTQKLLIVAAAQKMGHIVAVTGDGVNDSPALSQADIGCAMGIAGTEVTKEAADMILLTDDFSAIVLGIEEGRLIFDNLKKSIAYTLSSNIPEISPFIMFIIVRMPLSLTTVLILCVDLGTDMIPAISLAYEKPESDIMLRPPRDAEKDRLVTDKLICFAYLQIGVFQALAGFFTFFCVLNDYGWDIRAVPGQVLNFEAFPESESGKKISDDCPCGAGQKKTGNSFVTDKFAPIKHGMLDTTTGQYKKLSASNVAACPASDLGLVIDGDQMDENWPYGYACPYGAVKPNKKCKFGDAAGNGAVGSWATACYKPALALRKAQTSAFVSIVIVQWADLIICKTRLLSLADQGMQNQVMLFGLCSETILCMALCYLPFMNTAFSTAPIHPVHWFPSMPYSICIFLYDETRKYFLRSERKRLGGQSIGFVEKYTYY